MGYNPMVDDSAVRGGPYGSSPSAEVPVVHPALGLLLLWLFSSLCIEAVASVLQFILWGLRYRAYRQDMLWSNWIFWKCLS